MISNLELLAQRAYTVWGMGKVPYSMESTNSPTKHRCDCSGFVSAVLDLPTPGLSTVTLPSVLVQIPMSQIRPGCVVGLVGPGTEGAKGHVQMVTRVSANSVTIVHQSGGLGPTEQTLKRVDPSYTAWIVPYPEENDMTPEQSNWLLSTAQRIQHGILDGDPTMVDDPGHGTERPVWIVQKVNELADAVARIEKALVAGGAVNHVHSIPAAETGPAVPEEDQE